MGPRRVRPHVRASASETHEYSFILETKLANEMLGDMWSVESIVKLRCASSCGALGTPAHRQWRPRHCLMSYCLVLT